MPKIVDLPPVASLDPASAFVVSQAGAASRATGNQLITMLLASTAMTSFVNLGIRAESECVFPDEFDSAAASGTDHDDQPALQAMFNAAAATGKIAMLRPGKTYYPRSKITVDPTTTTFVSNGSEISFSQKTFTDPASSPQLISDSDFDTGTAWTASTNTTVPPSYTGGQLVFNAGGTEFTGSIDGTTLTVTAVASGVISTHAGAIAGSGIEIGTKITAFVSGTNGGVGVYTVNKPQTAPSVSIKQQQFVEIGQQITAAIGDIVRVSITIGEIAPLTIGSNTYRSANFSFRKNTGTANGSIAAGGQAGGNFTITFGSSTYKPGGVVTFDAVLTAANPYLRIQSNADIKINSITAKVLPDNTGILFRAVTSNRAVSRGIHQLRVTGKSSQQAWVDACVFDTQAAALTSRANFYGLSVGPSCGRGLVFQNRMYLAAFYGAQITASVACIDTLSGSEDAGENIGFFGGNCGAGSNAGSVGIRNMGGFALHFSQFSVDFVDTWYEGVGGAIFGDGCWFEKNENASLGKRYINLLTGRLKARGTRVQVDGDTVTNDIAPFFVGEGGWLDIEADVPYNIHGPDGAMCEGPGRFTWRGQGGVSKSIDAITKRDDDHNILGAGGRFEDSSIIIPAWVAAQAGQQQIDRYTIGVAAQGSISGVSAARGSNLVTGVGSGGFTNVGTLITDPAYPAGTTVSGYNSGTSVLTLTQNRNTAGITGGTVAYQLTSSARAGMRLAAGAGRNGTQALEFYKSGTGPGAFLCNIAVPIKGDRAFGAEWWYTVAAISGSSLVTGVYFQTLFVQLHDVPGLVIPIIGASRQFISDLPQTGIDLSVGKDWTRVVTSTNRVDAGATHDGYAPAWATHILITINLATVPIDFLMQFDDLHANLM